ncbi:Uncharacterized protein TCM_010116 [Theobroma cacao]|uniref:Retrotransposon Copia-like N-terminal domain-containing protein n=1 Tax=Theobroma cacao TaxID=3641 RepID=A0A061E5J2_THECC|nr:Uncharacterized protein TCM_010116 [Theobroma cacao]
MSEYTKSRFQGSQTSAQNTSQTSPMGDPQSPYYLYHTDHPGSVIINHELTTSNYVTWSRSPLSFMDALQQPYSIMRYAQPDDTRVCNLQFSLGNVTLRTRSVDTYFVELKGIWEELRNYRPLPCCQCGNCNPKCFKKYTDQYQKDMAFRFLNGLNDSFSAVRSQIILMDPIPTLDKVYSIVLREEAQRNIPFQAQPMLESSAMLAAADTKKKNRKDLICKATVNNVTMSNDASTEESYLEHVEEINGASTMSQMSNLQQQVNKLMEILSKNGLTSNDGKGISVNSHQTKHSLANSAFAGATNHISCSLRNFVYAKPVTNTFVQLPNSRKIAVTHIGIVKLTPLLTLTNDIPSWTVTGVARASSGLYFMEDKTNEHDLSSYCFEYH